MQKAMLMLIDSLLEQGEKRGDTDKEAYKGLSELRDGIAENKAYDELSLEALCALDALLMMISAS